MERLAKHPQVGGYGEVLLWPVEGWSDWPPGAADRPFYATYLKDRSLLRSPVARHALLFRYLDYLYAPRRGFRAIGFKLMYDQVRQFPQVLAYLRSRRAKVLHLTRLNLLDIVLSRKANQARRFAHARSPEEREMIRVHVDTSQLVPALLRLERERAGARTILRAFHVEVHELAYESLLANDRLLAETLRFLGIEVAGVDELTAVMLKLAPDSQREIIENYDEVALRLTGTRFQPFLRP